MSSNNSTSSSMVQSGQISRDVILVSAGVVSLLLFCMFTKCMVKKCKRKGSINSACTTNKTKASSVEELSSYTRIQPKSLTSPDEKKLWDTETYITSRNIELLDTLKPESNVDAKVEGRINVKCVPNIPSIPCVREAHQGKANINDKISSYLPEKDRNIWDIQNPISNYECQIGAIDQGNSYIEADIPRPSLYLQKPDMSGDTLDNQNSISNDDLQISVDIHENPYIPSEIPNPYFYLPKVDMSGNKWDIHKPISNDERQITVSGSDFRIEFTPESLKNLNDTNKCLDVFGSVHTEFKNLVSKLDLQEDEMLISPVAEFYIANVDTLPGYVTLELPLCVPVVTDTLRVKWISTSERLPSEDISKDDPQSSNLNVFYECAGFKTIKVFTKHFSIFYCTVCKQSIPFMLSATFYAKQSEQDGYPAVHLKMYLNGIQQQIKKDTTGKLHSREDENVAQKNGFLMIEHRNLSLPKKDKKDIILKFIMKPFLGDRDPVWIHAKELDEQKVAVSELMECWKRHHELSRCIEWFLQCTGSTCTTLKIFAEVKNINNVPESVSSDMKFILEVALKPVPAKETNGKSKFDTIPNSDLVSYAGPEGLSFPPQIQDPLFSLIVGLGNDGMRKLLKLFKCKDICPDQEDEREFWYKQLLHLSSESDIRYMVSTALGEMGVRMNKHIGDFFVHYNKTKYPTQVSEIDETSLKEPVLVQTPNTRNSVSESDNDHHEQTVPKHYIANSQNARTQMRDPVQNSESTLNTQLKTGLTSENGSPSMISSNGGNICESGISCANSLSSFTRM